MSLLLSISDQSMSGSPVESQAEVKADLVVYCYICILISQLEIKGLLNIYEITFVPKEHS